VSTSSNSTGENIKIVKSEVVTNKAGPWGVQEALPNQASKNYGPKKKL
jgi:hypothetical protein